MSFYTATTGALTNPASTMTVDYLSVRPDPTFDLLQFQGNQQSYEDILQPAMLLNQYSGYHPQKEAIVSDSSRDSDSSNDDDPTHSLLAAEMSKGGTAKPNLSYIALISMAIQSTPEKRMLLSEIYQWITDNFPYYRTKDKSWRNSIRHNLSLNECFVKNGRSDNGKGNYWSIHSANVDDFGKGDFRRRRARRRVRKCDEIQRMYQEGRTVPESTYYDTTPDRYVPMMTTCAPTPVLSNIFGADNVLSREEQLQNYYQQLSNVKPLPSIATVPAVSPNQTDNFGYKSCSSAVHVTSTVTVQSVQCDQTYTQSTQNTPNFGDNAFIPQPESQALPPISLSGPLPSWQDTLSRLQSDLGGTV